MSVVIRQDHAFTERDRNYLSQFEWGRLEIAENERLKEAGHFDNMPTPTDEKVIPLDKEVVERVKGLNVKEVQAELRRVGEDVTGGERALKVRLATVYQKERDQDKLRAHAESANQ